MIKRPGHEGYLRKLVEEERLAYLSHLKIGDSMAVDEIDEQTDSNSDEDQGLRLSLSAEDKDL